MVKRRRLIFASVLMSGLSGCGHSFADFEATCTKTFKIKNETNRELDIEFEIEARGVPEKDGSITLDAGSEKGYCDLIEGSNPIKITINTNAHSETTKVYDDYQGGYIIIVGIFEDKIEFSHMLV